MQNQNEKILEQKHNNTVKDEQKPPIYSKNKVALSRIKRRIFKHVWLARAGIIVLLAIFTLLFFWMIGHILIKTHSSSFPSLVKNFIFAPAGAVKSFEDRSNILILGKSGSGNDSPDLTDTLILASVGIDTPSISLISLPRDIWVPAIRAKLNSAYYWGNQKETGGGIVLVKSLVEEIVGVPVEYALVVDFSGFKEIIDVLGGIEVDVEQSFVDEKYPIAGRENDECGGDKEYKCRYETVSFEKGKVIMNGETALKFVRSRNAQGDEGTDIAREARQQKIILAIKDKILSPATLFSPKKILGLWEVAKSSIETDIPSSAGGVLLRKAFSARESVTSFVIPEDYLVNPPISPRYDSQYVFLPSGGDWKTVHEWVGTKLK